MGEAVAGHALDLPSPGQVCVSVMRVSGDQAVGVWRGICLQARVPVIAPAYTREQLEQLASALTARSGALATVGRSLRIRLLSHQTLTRRSR